MLSHVKLAVGTIPISVELSCSLKSYTTQNFFVNRKTIVALRVCILKSTLYLNVNTFMRTLSVTGQYFMIIFTQKGTKMV